MYKKYYFMPLLCLSHLSYADIDVNNISYMEVVPASINVTDHVYGNSREQLVYKANIYFKNAVTEANANEYLSALSVTSNLGTYKTTHTIASEACTLGIDMTDNLIRPQSDVGNAFNLNNIDPFSSLNTYFFPMSNDQTSANKNSQWHGNICVTDKPNNLENGVLGSASQISNIHMHKKTSSAMEDQASKTFYVQVNANQNITFNLGLKLCNQSGQCLLTDHGREGVAVVKKVPYRDIQACYSQASLSIGPPYNIYVKLKDVSNNSYLSPLYATASIHPLHYPENIKTLPYGSAVAKQNDAVAIAAPNYGIVQKGDVFDDQGIYFLTNKSISWLISRSPIASSAKASVVNVVPSQNLIMYYFGNSNQPPQGQTYYVMDAFGNMYRYEAQITTTAAGSPQVLIPSCYQ